MSQSSFSDPEAASPYGGVAVTVGELASSGAASPLNSLPGICPGSPDCVLTGQFNRGRQGLNKTEPTLTGYAATLPNTFTNINYYQTDSTDYYSASGFTYNPIMAQPLWVSNVPISGLSGTYNVLYSVTMNDSVYAFAADNSTPPTLAGTILWKINASSGNPLSKNCGSTGTPVTPAASGPVASTLPYYGAVSTPVIDTVTSHPVIYVVSGCSVVQGGVTVVGWYLNAIDATSGNQNLVSGTVGGAGGLQITAASGFLPANEFQRPALLLTHAKDSGGVMKTYLYIAFGTAIYEIGSGTQQGYNGYVFGYEIHYASGLPSSVSATALSNSPFVTTPNDGVSGVFPNVSTAAIGSGLAGSGPYDNPSCGLSDPNRQACYHGDNWADSTNMTGHGGGVWMAGKGPSSDITGNVYFSAGNGTFDCNTSGNSTCTSTNVSAVNNFAESAIELTEASASGADYFTPNFPNFLNDKNGSFPTGHSAAATKAQALNRYDLDFGTPGVLLFGTALGSGSQTWAVSADKTGYVYSMPTLESGTGSTGMGQFQSGDAGLTSGSFTTQAPFQLSRLPPLSGTSTTTCPYPSTTHLLHFLGSDCDQIMELAYWNNYLFAWPENETLIAAKGTGTSGSPTNYTFSTTYIDPCNGATSCTNFPQAEYPGGNLAIAANGSTSYVTLWVSLVNAATGTGELWGYSVNYGSSFFTMIYDPAIQTANATRCTGLPMTLPGSYVPASFAEPTLVNGMVFAPVFKAKTSSGSVITGGGILVYGACS